MKNLTRTQAARTTRAAQIGGLVLGTASVFAAITLRADDPERLVEIPAPAPGAGSDGTPSPTDAPPGDRPELASIARQLAVAWTPPASPNAPVAPPPDAGQGQPTAGSSEWRFLGPIIEPSRRLALLTNGRQRIAAEGELLNLEARLAEVGDDYIVIDERGRKTRIDLALRSGTRLSTSSSPLPGVNPGVFANPALQGDGGTGEDIAAIIREREARAARARLQTRIGQDGSTTTTAPPTPEQIEAMRAASESAEDQ